MKLRTMALEGVLPRISKALFLGFVMIPSLSNAGKILNHADWYRVHSASGSLHGVENWSKAPGDIGELALSHRAIGPTGQSGLVFYGKLDVKSEKTTYGNRSEGYGAIDSGAGYKKFDGSWQYTDMTNKAINQFAMPDGGTATIKIGGLFNNYSTRKIYDVSSSFYRGSDSAGTVSLIIKSGTGTQGKVTNLFEENMSESFSVQRRGSEYVSKRTASAVEKGNTSLTIHTHYNRGEINGQLMVGKESLSFSMPPPKGHDVVNVEAKLPDQVTIGTLDAEGALHMTLYKVTKTNEKLGLPDSFRAKLVPVRETAVYRDAIKALKLAGEIRITPGAQAVPAGGSVQGLQIRTATAQ